MYHSRQEFRDHVVECALKYKGDFFRRLDLEPDPDNHELLDLGTTPEHGFNCSGFVIRSICDALGTAPRGSWRPEHRTAHAMTRSIHNVAKYPPLDPRSVEPADLISWINTEGHAYHVVLALHQPDPDAIHFIHTKFTDEKKGIGDVGVGAFSARIPKSIVHLPLFEVLNHVLLPQPLTSNQLGSLNLARHN